MSLELDPDPGARFPDPVPTDAGPAESISTDPGSLPVARSATEQQPEKLSDRAIRSSASLFVIRAAVAGSLMLQVVLLVKFLSPEQFGIVGLALLCLSMLRTFTEAGIEQALIQRAGDIRTHLHTAWTIQVIRGALIATALFLLGPMYCQFFNEPEATGFIQAFGIPMLILGFTNIGIVEYKKQVQHNKLISFEVVPAVLNLLVSVFVAYQYQTVWAILFGRIADSVAAVLISFRMHTFRPRLQIYLPHFWDLFRFGKWIYMSTILLFLLNQGDNFVVGKMLGAAWLGYYQFGFRIAKLPITEVNNAIGQVLFSAFSRLQHDIPRMKSAYLRSLTVILTLTIPLTFGIFVIAPYAVPATLGQKWLPSVPLIQIFSLLGLLVSVGSSTGHVFKAVGKPSILTLSQFCRAVIMFSLMIPMIRWNGAVGAAYAVVLSELAIGGFLILAVGNVLQASIRDALRCCSIQLVAAFSMAFGVHFVGTQLSHPDTIPYVVLLIFVGATIYGSLVALMDAILDLELIAMLQGIFTRWRK